MVEGQASEDGEWSSGGCCYVQAASVSACRDDGEHLRVSFFWRLSHPGQWRPGDGAHTARHVLNNW